VAPRRSAREEFDIDSTTVAINGGEDYELLLPLLWKILIKLKETISPSLDI
jgi:thiamine monophosphate kinase